jgi:hypothetical protein
MKLYDGANISRSPEAAKEGYLSLKTKALRTFQTPGTIHPLIQRHMPEDLHFQQHRCENVKLAKPIVPSYM